MNVDRFQILTSKVNKLKQEQDRATGAYEHIMEQLQRDYGVKTIKDGEKMLTEREKDLQESKQAQDKALDEIEAKYMDVLKDAI